MESSKIIMAAKLIIDIDPDIFNNFYLPFLEDNTEEQHFIGGAGSGKSVFIVQRMVCVDLWKNRNYLCVRKEASTITGSVWNEIVKQIGEHKLTKYYDIQQRMIINRVTGYGVYFAGLDDPEKLRSIVPIKSVITDIWIEEAAARQHGVTYDDYKQLTKRLRGETADNLIKRMILSYNPISKRHWLYAHLKEKKWMDTDRVYRGDNILIARTTHKDNKFLSEQDRRNLESETDPYYRIVYTEGLFASPNIEGKVFTGFSEDNIKEDYILENILDYRYRFGGYDRGYTHRAGIVVIGITDNFEVHVLEAIGRNKIPFMSTDGSDNILKWIKDYHAKYQCDAWFCSHEAVDQIEILNKEKIQAKSWLTSFSKDDVVNIKSGDTNKSLRRVEYLNLLLRENMILLKREFKDLINEIVDMEYKKLPDNTFNCNEIIRVNDDICDALMFSVGGYKLVRIATTKLIQQKMRGSHNQAA